MKKLYSIVFTFACLIISSFAMAQTGVHVDYCEGQLEGGTITSKTASKKDVLAAIKLTPDMLEPYVGCQITKVVAGFSETIETMPEEVSGWVRIDDNASAPVATSTKQTATKGWNDLTLEKPYTITGKEEAIWIGYQFYQAKAMKCITFAGDAYEEACYLGTETVQSTGDKTYNWANVSRSIGGSLCIRALLEGNVPQRDIYMRKVDCTAPLFQVGKDIEVSAVLGNRSHTAAVNPVIKYTVNGVAGSYTYPGTLAYGDRVTHTIPVKTASITTPQAANITLSFEWADGKQDDYAADNTAETSTEMVNKVPMRKMVAEEATGTWCGFCVRGYVGMYKMKEKYPDRFIGIAVHNGDKFTYPIYDSWMGDFITGYPSALINRDGKVYDPSEEIFEAYMETMLKVCFADVKTRANLEGNMLHMEADVDFVKTEPHEYRIAFVVLEDGVMGSQHNYFAGGSYGPMDGFENEKSTVVLPMNDAARYITNPLGDENSLPAAVEKNVVYHYDADLDITSTAIVDAKNISVVALLIDATTGKIVNADKTEFKDATGICDVHSSQSTSGVITDICGRRLQNAPAKGIFIQNGKKYIK